MSEIFEHRLIGTIHVNSYYKLATLDRYIPNGVVDFFCALGRRIDPSQLVCTENHLGCFNMT